MTDPRPSWDDYFLGIATAVSTRADCSRRKVGAVLVKDRRIVSTGYNGSWAGGPSCLLGQCPRGTRSYDEVSAGSSYDTDGTSGLCHANHAEANAVLYADRGDCRDSTIYLTCAPCLGCLRILRGAGIRRAVFPGGEIPLDTIHTIQDMVTHTI